MFKLDRLRYRHKVAAIIFVFALLPMLVLGSFLTSRIYSSKVKDILAEKQTQLESSASSVNAILDSNVNKVEFINSNYFIINYLETSYKENNLVRIMNFSDYLQSVMKAAKTENTQTEIVIYALKDTNYDGEYLRSIGSLENEQADASTSSTSLKDAILNTNNTELLWLIKKAKLNANSTMKADYIYAYKQLISLNRPLAIIEMRIQLNQLINFFPSDIPKGSYINFEGSGQYGDYRLRADADVKPGASYYVLNQSLHTPLGHVSWYIPKSLVFQELKWYWVSVGVIFLIIVGILVFTVEVVSYYLTKRLEALLRKMNKNVESLISEEDSMMNPSTHDEFERMGNSYYELIQRVKEYYKRITDYELERKVLETQLLQERFNPHFLYNTLSTIRSISGDKQVKDVINSMVKYYRIALNKGSSIVTIVQELEMIEQYLRLQKFAFGTEFHYEIQYDEGIGYRPVLKHLLQPVVENAVLHGLIGRETGGIVRISAKQDGDDVLFAISDNGAGMDAAQIEQLLEGEACGLYGGYGMKNVRKRLEIFYPKLHKLEIRSEPGNGTTVRIRIPAAIHIGEQSSLDIAR
ncbi:sensor histidine kinase [Paenibacillus sp. CF384]|uniref:sensor histidine kinase n=1 Tax=Paenibacillus sp. CF384 TaxID=1884382 RepID=UPI00089A2C37|nr:histidine kinase [Paenibacillus sp. CF384]SDX63619.1 Histidine kinase-, DNA gyrase B-, and HSP90-like ATPase [Paenibacillus sp. CF384]